MSNIAQLVPRQLPILDVGCGSGWISKVIPAELSYIGIDFNPDYLSRDWMGRAVDGKIMGSILRLPFKSNSFKTVLLLHAIEHFPQQLQTPLLKEAYRVLSLNGTFIISTPNRGTLRNADKFLPPHNPKHFHCLRVEELLDLLDEIGFRKLKRHGYDILLEYPTPLAKLIPYRLRRDLAGVFSVLEKYLIFTSTKE